MVDPSSRRFVRWLLSGITLASLAPSMVWSAQIRNGTIGIHGTVTTVPAGELIRKSDNFFDLDETTLTFRPNGAGGYSVAVGALTWEDPGLVPVRRLKELVRRARRRVDEPSRSSEGVGR